MESAILDAELLLADVLGVNRSKFYSTPELVVAAGDSEKFWQLIKLRQTGKPVAYLLGEKEFWSMNFSVNSNVLIPRPETERLVETVLENLDPANKTRILDLGTGSGAIAVALATELPNADIVAVDTCHDALTMAVANARRLGKHNIEFMLSNWFSAVTGKFDVIVSNPPYIPSNDKHLADPALSFEPRLALDGGVTGLDAINNIIKNSARYLLSHGLLVLEHGYNQGKNVRDLLLRSGFTEINTSLDYAGLERISSARRGSDNE